MLTYTITLADGRQITDLKINGNNYVSRMPYDMGIFTKDALKKVIITPHGEPSKYDVQTEEIVLHNAKVNDQQEYAGEFYIAFYERSSSEILEEAMLMAIAEIYEKVATQEAK